MQTYLVHGVPLTTTFTLRTLGFCLAKARLETCERVMLILRPNKISF
ncbi:hypothetical protein HMPREF0868_0572 [Mageeibacillus indolicus UPII9-5]|uniref:Uncharacterized protein n=1 Tax=Mageeibacillus indolicus (strain UPII9-5) TaxID=699246 RepID=D3R138_MAGIU|nr:hypothetical protein HMPREF0868_0572 [Mageeibacillus indolicus UPII9-5]